MLELIVWFHKSSYENAPLMNASLGVGLLLHRTIYFLYIYIYMQLNVSSPLHHQKTHIRQTCLIQSFNILIGHLKFEWFVVNRCGSKYKNPKRCVFKKIEILVYVKYNVQHFFNLDQIKIQNMMITSLGSKVNKMLGGGEGAI